MSKESSTIVGQRWSYSSTSYVKGVAHDNYVRLDPMGQHGRDLSRFLMPVQVSRVRR